jgi:hypothetical protein
VIRTEDGGLRGKAERQAKGKTERQRGILGRVGTAHHQVVKVRPGSFKKGYGVRAGAGLERLVWEGFWVL